MTLTLGRNLKLRIVKFLRRSYYFYFLCLRCEGRCLRLRNVLVLLQVSDGRVNVGVALFHVLFGCLVKDLVLALFLHILNSRRPFLLLFFPPSNLHQFYPPTLDLNSLGSLFSFFLRFYLKRKGAVLKSESGRQLFSANVLHTYVRHTQVAEIKRRMARVHLPEKSLVLVLGVSFLQENSGPGSVHFRRTAGWINCLVPHFN